MFLWIKIASSKNFLNKKVTLNTAHLACLANNTEYHDIFMRCVCKSGFPYGNPEKGGCYGCSKVTCHPDAYCAAQDTCKCKAGRVGDGITTCDYPRPIIQKVEPQTCIVNDESYIKFSFKSPKGYNTTKPDCRFCPRVVTPTEFNGTHGICKCPPSYEGKYPFALTFNGIHWSQENFSINFTSYSMKNENILGVFELIVVTCVIIGFSAWLIIRLTKKNSDDGEIILPLNKWHMSQATHDPGEENNFFKYLLGLIIG